MRIKTLAAGCLVAALSATMTQAAFIVEADSRNVAPNAAVGKANANFSMNSPLSFSTGNSTAPGLTGDDSVFGGTVNPDTYTFRYTPGVDVDNTTFTLGDVLGNSSAIDADGLGPIAPVYANVPQLATGLVGGASGIYNVYFTTPDSTNVEALGSNFVINNALTAVALNPVVLNNGATGPDTTPPGGAHVGGANNLWLKIGTVVLNANTTYTIVQTANGTTSVSQRAHGVMWEFVGPVIPEPSSAILAAIGCIGLLNARRRAA